MLILMQMHLLTRMRMLKLMQILIVLLMLIQTQMLIHMQILKLLHKQMPRQMLKLTHKQMQDLLFMQFLQQNQQIYKMRNHYLLFMEAKILLNLQKFQAINMEVWQEILTYNMKDLYIREILAPKYKSQQLILKPLILLLNQVSNKTLSSLDKQTTMESEKLMSQFTMTIQSTWWKTLEILTIFKQ